MRIRNNILVVDTETVGDFAQPLIHDIGYAIIDRDFNRLLYRRFLVQEVRDCKWLLYSEFYKKKAGDYDRAIHDNEVYILPWLEIVKILLNDIKRYNITTIAAYNMAFDYKALNFTSNFLHYSTNNKLMKKINSLKLLCIWGLACDSILQTQEFKDWAEANDKLTLKGNYITNAEVVYQFITGNNEFQEAHTALDDVKIETDILQHIITQCKGIAKYGLQYGCWQRVKRE